MNLTKALGHPARIAILTTLAKRNTCVCGEIVEVMPLAQSTVSQHLKALKEAGFVKGDVEGLKSCYCIDFAVVEEFAKSIESFLNTMQQAKSKTECC
jgi:ArsR family transcriptional regulator